MRRTKLMRSGPTEREGGRSLFAEPCRWLVTPDQAPIQNKGEAVGEIRYYSEAPRHLR